MKKLYLILSLPIQGFCTPITEFSFILKPSSIPGAGIGLFATHDIKQGSVINFFPENYQFRILHKKEIPAEFIKLTVALENDLYMCPDRFDCIEASWYMNHSFFPNVHMVSLSTFIAIKDIKKGEEVVMDYNELGEPEDKKEEYYKIKNKTN